MTTLTHALVDDLRLATRLSDLDARQVRRYLEQHADPESTRQYFKDADALRTAAHVFDKAVDVGVFSYSVALGIEKARMSVAAGQLRAYSQMHIVAPPKAKAPNPQPASEPAATPPPFDGDDNACIFALTHTLVDDARLATRLSDNEGRRVRLYLEQYAEPESTRQDFKDADALRTAALVFDKAVEVGVHWDSVADALDYAEKKAVSDVLRMKAKRPLVVSEPSTSSEPAAPPPPQSTDDDSSCVVCMDSNRNATMQCGHANICFTCGGEMAACPTCRAPKKWLMKLYQ